jgi:hypothetical protein
MAHMLLFPIWLVAFREQYEASEPTLAIHQPSRSDAMIVLSASILVPAFMICHFLLSIWLGMNIVVGYNVDPSFPYHFFFPRLGLLAIFTPQIALFFKILSV